MVSGTLLHLPNTHDSIYAVEASVYGKNLGCGAIVYGVGASVYGNRGGLPIHAAAAQAAVSFRNFRFSPKEAYATTLPSSMLQVTVSQRTPQEVGCSPEAPCGLQSPTSSLQEGSPDYSWVLSLTVTLKVSQSERN